MKKTIKLLAQEHPIIDLVAKVQPSFLQKYGLPVNATVQPIPSLIPVYDELLKNPACALRPAGSALNTLRACQHVIRPRYPSSTMFMGAIGNDIYGKRLAEDIRKHGMLDCLHIHDKLQTGVCAVLLTQGNRCLIPNLGAACAYPDSHTTEQWSVVERAERYYSTSYFLSTNYKAIKKVFEFAAKKGRPAYFNLGAKTWVQKHSKEILDILPTVEGVIGNLEETTQLGKLISTEGKTIDEHITNICNYDLKGRRQKRFVVVTDSTNPVILGELKPDGEVEITRVETPSIPKAFVKNTNGAGDTLAGGFIAGLILGQDLVAALKIGQRLTSYYIQQMDGSYPLTII